MVGEALVCVWHLGMGEAQRRICLREADVGVRCFGVLQKEDGSVTEYPECLNAPPMSLVLWYWGEGPGLETRVTQPETVFHCSNYSFFQ